MSRQFRISSVALAAITIFHIMPPVFAQPGGGGFTPPAPPVIEAIDRDKDGVISAEELKDSLTALRALDKNNDGELAGEELLPEFMRGGGGSRGPGGGRGGGRGGFGGAAFSGEGTAQQVLPEQLEFRDGVAVVPDEETYHKLAYKGQEVMIDTFLADLEFVKFTLNDAASADRQLYFINTKTHRAHPMFARVAGLPGGPGRGDEQMKGVLVYRPNVIAPDGKPGLFTFEFEPFDAYAFKMVNICRDILIAKMPTLKGRIGYYPRGERATAAYWNDKTLYKQADLPVYMDSDLTSSDAAFQPFNLGMSFGRLRVMNLDERPGPRDIVLYRSLPNEMPRVAGIITEVRQTPLSHVNLRAVQDNVPNAFIANASNDESIAALIGREVAYRVALDRFEVRAATQQEVDQHFAQIRPTTKQVPERDVSMREIRPLEEIDFHDFNQVGVKAANVAAMRTFKLPSGMVPDGFAIPFYFYDEFMKHNGFYEYASNLLKNRDFQNDPEVQETELKKLRALIKKGKMPDWMMTSLDELHQQFPKGSSLRCRSSTNNEDLPNFSGAGLYDSFTHKPDEGHLSKTIRQVYASLWNFRAFDERDFYRVDHLAAAMGVLVHPNFKDELANGVAVTDDILYGTHGNYYLNSQVGEDLITNPDELSIPEELLLDWDDSAKVQVMRTSSRSKGDKLLLSDDHIEQMRKQLGRIHGLFAKLYGKDPDDDQFAMEVEFKVDKHGQLVIKQARPWIYSEASVAAGRDGNGGGFGGRGGFGGPGGGPPGGPGMFGGGPGGPGRPFGPPQFALMTALDVDSDGKISQTELNDSVANLTALDKDKDGSLSSNEIGWPPSFGGR